MSRVKMLCRQTIRILEIDDRRCDRQADAKARKQGKMVFTPLPFLPHLREQQGDGRRTRVADLRRI